MSCSCGNAGPQLCGCCTGVTAETPVLVVNRPALPSISYRVGTYSSFMQSMLAGLSSSSVPALAALRTRSSGDFSIAVVDAWSEVLDILTFYTERLANEAYLGTAVEGRSVFELARLVGYQPSPGVSASTVLVFTLSSAPGSPATVPIAAGTRVQSVPGPGQTPQVFETSSAITATLAVNAIPAATTQPWQLAGADTSTWVSGTANNIKVGDALLFLSAPGGKPSPAGPGAVVYVTSVKVSSSSGDTFITWDTPLPAGFVAGSSGVSLYIFRTKGALFGVGSPKPGIFPTATFDTIPGTPGGTPSKDSEWAFQYAGGGTINLDASYPGLSPAATSPDGSPDQLQWLVLTGPKYTSILQITRASESNPGLYSLSSKTSQITLGSVLVLRGNTSLTLDQVLNDFTAETRQTTAYVQSQLLTFADLPLTQWTSPNSFPLASAMFAPVSGGGMSLSGLQPLASGAPVGLSGKRVRIVSTVALTGTLTSGTANGGFTPGGSTGALAVSINQPFLVDAFPPQADTSSGNLLWSVLTITGQAGTLSLPPATVQLQPSATSDPQTGEVAIISAVTVNGTTTSLTFDAALGRIYDAPTVIANANAVEATHGETVQEILGSGNGTNAALQFQLKQSPLTYVSAATANGAQSTLQVRVNNLLWTEQPNLLSAAPKDRVYVTRPNAGGGRAVQFGNGIQGSRTPTGQLNIKAQYRKGIGLAGMVAAGQLSQALDRPLGVQGVSNPVAATGGADPATPVDARQSAPLPTLTLGRVVTLEDYQNFALAFGGIGMALASWTWFGSTRGIFLTVAGDGGSALSANDPVVQNLSLAIQDFGLPYVPLQIASYLPVLFEISLQVKVDSPTFDSTMVIAQVWQALATAFAFGMLAPGQGVAASQIIQIAQSVPGVIAVYLAGLNRSGSLVTVADLLCAAGPQPPLGAEILILDPQSEAGIGVWS
jgi:hypothetical protein